MTLSEMANPYMKATFDTMVGKAGDTTLGDVVGHALSLHCRVDVCHVLTEHLSRSVAHAITGLQLFTSPSEIKIVGQCPASIANVFADWDFVDVYVDARFVNSTVFSGRHEPDDVDYTFDFSTGNRCGAFSSMLYHILAGFAPLKVCRIRRPEFRRRTVQVLEFGRARFYFNYVDPTNFRFTNSSS